MSTRRLTAHERSSWARTLSGEVAGRLRSGKFWRCAHEPEGLAVVRLWAPEYVMCVPCAVPNLVEHDHAQRCDRCGGYVNHDKLLRVAAPVEGYPRSTIAYVLCPACALREVVA